MKKLLTLLLCIAVLIGLLSAVGSADAGLTFLSVNDALPPELFNVAVSYGSDLYVPYWVFTSYGLGLSYSFFVGNSTAYLHDSDRQIFFELSTGKTYDGDDFRYSTPGIFQGGTVYLPLYFLCSYFGGIRCTAVGSTEYGTLIRIANGSEVLTDEEFLRAAKPAMKRYYQSYTKPASPSPTPGAPVPSPTAVPDVPLPHLGDTVRLGFTGLPDRETLSLLEQARVPAAFFLTAEEAAADPDRVRELSCRGYGLGARCEEGTAEEYAAVTGLLWELTRVPVLSALAPETHSLPEGAVVFPLPAAPAPDAVYALTGALETFSGNAVVLYAPEDGTALKILLNYLQDQGFAALPLRETDGACPCILP